MKAKVTPEELEANDRELVQRELSDSALSPAAVTAVIAELMYISDRSGLEYWADRTRVDGGLALTGANAARRAHQRLGLWPLIEHLEKYLVPHVSAERADKARRALARARATKAADKYDPPYDACKGAPRLAKFEVLYAHYEEDEGRLEPPPDRCLERLEFLAWNAIDSEHIEYDVALEVFQIVHVLATEVSRSAARELVADIEALGTEKP